MIAIKYVEREKMDAVHKDLPRDKNYYEEIFAVNLQGVLEDLYKAYISKKQIKNDRQREEELGQEFKFLFEKLSDYPGLFPTAGSKKFIKKIKNMASEDPGTQYRKAVILSWTKRCHREKIFHFLCWIHALNASHPFWLSGKKALVDFMKTDETERLLDRWT